MSLTFEVAFLILTTRPGHYLFMDADTGFMGAQAVLESQVMPAGDYCFEFYYLMADPDNGGELAMVRVTQKITRSQLLK